VAKYPRSLQLERATIDNLPALWKSMCSTNYGRSTHFTT